MSTENWSEQVRVRFEKLAKIRIQNENPYKNGYKSSDLAFDLHSKYNEKTREILTELSIACSVAGRIMAIRLFGKAAFVTIKDRSGNIQLFVQKDKLGDGAYARFKELDVGDVIFSKGTLFKTKTDELSIHAETLVLLTKSLQPLPEKYHGIADVELKYRKRYLDLIMSDQTKAVFYTRFKIIEVIRKFFQAMDFVEVETPMMHPIAGGALARPFETHHNTLDMQLYLRVAPELYLKRLVVGGFERVFEINRNFRNEGISIKHNPEFTMLEFYQAYATYEDLILLTQELFQNIADQVLGTRTLTYQQAEINLDGAWKKLPFEEAVLTYSDFKEKQNIRNHAKLLEYGQSKGYAMDTNSSVGELQEVIFDEEVEKHLIQPTFITLYPLDISPLSRKNEQDPFLVDRFELYIYGREMANAFSELNDPVDQKERFLAQVKAKEQGNAEACEMDEDYVTALEYGMPPTAGEGIGIDRLVMLFTNAASIRDVILFPLMRKHE
ncbi:MAG: lysine--tRNA ligase [Deltaproteobacteria bacterium]|nr:lysine--tRNA ligase [Deltaproteobacteria bacterium]